MCNIFKRVLAYNLLPESINCLRFINIATLVSVASRHYNLKRAIGCFSSFPLLVPNTCREIKQSANIYWTAGLPIAELTHPREGRRRRSGDCAVDSRYYSSPTVV